MFLSVFSVHSTVMESFDAILKGFPHYIHIIRQCSIRPGNIWLMVVFTMITWCIFQFMNSHNRGALLTGEGHAFVLIHPIWVSDCVGSLSISISDWCLKIKHCDNPPGTSVKRCRMSPRDVAHFSAWCAWGISCLGKDTASQLFNEVKNWYDKCNVFDSLPKRHHRCRVERLPTRAELMKRSAARHFLAQLFSLTV